MRIAVPRPALSTAARLLLTPAAVLLLLLAFAGRADAGAWGTPVSVSTAGQMANKASIGGDAAGDQVAAWQVYVGGNSEYAVEAAVRSGGSWSPPVDLTTAVRFEREPVVAVNASGEAIVAWSTWTGSNNQVEIVRGDVAGDWGAPEVISTPGVNSGGVDVALDGAGAAFVTWRQMMEGGFYEPAVTTDEGGSWSTPQVLNPSTSYSAETPIVKVDPKGDAVVAWDRNEAVEAASRPAGGSWSGPTELANFGVNSIGAPVKLAIDEAGEAAAIWGTANGGPRLETARMSPSGTWSAAEVIASSSRTYFETTIALTPTGEEIAVWTGEEAGSPVLMTARRPVAGAWTEPTALHATGEQYGLSLVADATGTATAIWENGYEVAGEWVETIGAARLPASGGWGPALELSEPGEEAYGAALDVDATGGVTAAWMNWVETPGPSYESVVRSAYLPGATASGSDGTGGGGTDGGDASAIKTAPSPTPIVCTAPAGVVAAKEYVPATTRLGKTIPGVRARISVPTPSKVGVTATFTYKGHAVAGGDYSMTMAKSGNLRVAVPGSLRSKLPFGSKVAVSLRIVSTPKGSSPCAAPVTTTRKLTLKVVRVLSGAGR
jgi:hypothetical protein